MQKGVLCFWLLEQRPPRRHDLPREVYGVTNRPLMGTPSIQPRLEATMEEGKNDALSLEYKLVEGCATGDLDLSNVVNKPVVEGEGRILGLGLQEEFPSVVIGDLRPFDKNLRDSVLVGLD